jgi:Na+-driven multidrug efflux pump
MMFANMGVIYYVLRDFGAAAQAGFGIGSRVMGLIQVPAMAIAFAAGPIAGQNFGAGNSERVRETFKKVALIGTALMITVTMAAQWRPDLLLGGLAKDAATMAVAALFLQMVSLNLVAQGLIFVCSAMFQGLGNTKPVLLSSGARLITYGMPVIWLSAQSGFRIVDVWYLSIATTTLQAVLSLWLLRREFGKRLVAFVPGSGEGAPGPEQRRAFSRGG